jgi:hypothetical protein
MNKVSVFAACAAGAGFALVGAAGVAAAAPVGSPDVEGDTYADASSALSDAGYTPVIGVVIGGKLPTDECIVEGVQIVSALRPEAIDEGYPQYYAADSEAMLTLNCNGGFATATDPGNSVMSPEGRAALEEAAAAEEQELAEASTPGQ